MSHGLGVGRVVRVDYSTHEIVLQIISGENDLYQRTATTNLYPVAGARTFMGGLPEPGDLCVVGWLATSNKTPMILGWIPIGISAGMEWLPVQDFLPTEVDMNPKIRSQYEGIYSRRRFKMRPMKPGDLYLSSSKGADIYLDEGVSISNRRLSEIRLRDQDQALVLRSLVHFQALGGARVYAGPVQRDARLLPFRVIQDGVEWDAPIQVEGSTPLPPFALGSEAKGKFRPHPVFQKSDISKPFFDSGFEVDSNVDPYALLARGLWIGPDGYMQDPSARTDVEYGGKPIYRVSQSSDGTPPNGAGPNVDTLTEYRIELMHTSDGTLPVTEQTEGFDSDRLPSTATQGQATDVPRPIVEWALGSVVGNQPFSVQEKGLYGIPLLPKIFDGPVLDPRLESGLGEDIHRHAATLLRITPPLRDPGTNPSAFLCMTKQGSARVFLSGPQTEDSLEIAARGGVRMEAGGRIRLKGTSLELDFAEGDDSNRAFSVVTQTGSVRLSAGGPTTQGSASARGTNSKVREEQLPALTLEAPTSNVWVTAGKAVKIASGTTIQVGDAQEVSVSAKRSLRLFSDKMIQQCNTLDRTVQGQERTLYIGPKNFVPSNGPTREVTFGGTPATGQTGGVVDRYKVQFGDREETFVAGNHTTKVVVGDLTYQTGLGKWRAEAGTNTLEVSSTGGIDGNVLVGSVKMVAVSTISLQGLAGATMKSGALTRVSGSTVVLGAVGKTGAIVSGADLDPLTNLPLSFFNMGSPGHLLGPSI